MPSISVKDSSEAVVTVQTLPAVGQGIAAASLPVVLASDQSAIPIVFSTGATSALQTTGNASLTSIDGKLTTVATSTAQSTGNASLSSIDGKLPTLVSSRIPVDGSGVTQPVSGQSTVVGVTFTRPADTTAYAALDNVANSTSAPTILTFTNIARINAGSGYIVKAKVITDQSTNTARFRLHLFHTAPTAINDNAAYTTLWANNANKIGWIDFDAAGTEGTGSTAAESLNTSVRLKYICAAASRTIYGVLETRDAFTPASAQNFFVELTSEVD